MLTLRATNQNTRHLYTRMYSYAFPNQKSSYLLHVAEHIKPTIEHTSTFFAVEPMYEVGAVILVCVFITKYKSSLYLTAHLVFQVVDVFLTKHSSQQFKRTALFNKKVHSLKVQSCTFMVISHWHETSISAQSKSRAQCGSGF